MKPLGIGIIGCGGIAKEHAKAYAHFPDACRIVAVCDIEPAKAEAFAAEYGSPKVYPNFAALIEDPAVDVVSVTTPNAFHAAPTVAALAADKHVLCEKPLARNLDESRAMLAAAGRSKAILQIGYQLRFCATAKALFADIAELGDIYYARSQALRRRGVPTWGVFTNKELQGGGPLMDIGVHALDLTLHFMGHPKPVSAFGVTADRLAKSPETSNVWGAFDPASFQVEELAVGLIRFENGAAITLESSFLGNWEANGMRAELLGTAAGAVWTHPEARIIGDVAGQPAPRALLADPQHRGDHVESIAAFLESIKDGLPSQVPVEQAFMVNAIVDALYRSAESGVAEPVASA